MVSLFAMARPDLEDFARAAAEKIRSGVPEIERELSKEILLGLGADALPMVERLAASMSPVSRVAALEIWSGRSFDQPHDKSQQAARFLPFLADASYAVRKAALEGLQNASDGRSVSGRVDPLLHDPFWPVRAAALGAKAAWPLTGTAAHFLNALSDPEPMVRRTALWFMSELAETIPPAALAAAAKGLTQREDLAFLKACRPLVREENLSYFAARAKAERGTPAGTQALLVAAGLTRSVEVSWIPLLIDQSLKGGKVLGEAAALLLTLTRGDLVEPIRLGLLKGGEGEAISPRALVHILLSVLEREAIPILAQWSLDENFPAPAREAFLDGLVARDWEEGAKALARVYPGLEERLKRRAAGRAFGLARGRMAPWIVPLLLDALEQTDPHTREKAFEGLCLVPEPPLDALALAFKEEKEGKRRARYIGYLGNAASGERRERVARLFYEEVDGRGPAAIEAASGLHAVVDERRVAEMVQAVIDLLEEQDDPLKKETLRAALLPFDRPEAERAVVKGILEDLEKGGQLNLRYLVGRMDRTRGPATAGLLYRIFPNARTDMKKTILRVLVRRDDPIAVEWMDIIFSETKVTYKKSILDEVAGSELAGACTEVLRKVILQEKDPELLGSAVEAAPLPLLRELEPRLLALAEIGPELGIAATEAVFYALARVGSSLTRSYLRRTVVEFMEQAESKGPLEIEGVPADLALLAAQGLAAARDPSAPDLLAGLLFLPALALREREIWAEWKAESLGGTAGKTHSFARAVLRSLLLFEDGIVEKAVMKVLDAWEEDGRIYQCGDAAFSTLARELIEHNRCQNLAERLAALTLRCAPAHSPSDFRILLLKGDQAANRGNLEAAVSALQAAWHIMKFYTPARAVVRDELDLADPFRGYLPAAALASDLFRMRAMMYASQGQNDLAEEERRRAQRRSPFRR